jgi:alkylated DNA repair dioxygenase AlkB
MPFVPISLIDGEARFMADFLTRPQSDAFFAELLDLVDWEQHVIRIRGREVASPRLSAWYGDPDAHYSYSGLSLAPRPWLPGILELKNRVEAVCKAPFNSVLLNLYRDGADSMGWHSDDEPELGERPVIASLSLGATRRFRMRHRRRKELEPVAIDLEDGSLLIMRGDTQRFWKHQIPKTRRATGPRLNLTFRKILQAPLGGPDPRSANR